MTITMRVATRRSLAIIAFACTVGILLLPINPSFPSAGLDPSWQLGLNQAFTQGLPFGRDIAFTYGPYAAIDTRAFAPSTYHLAALLAGWLGCCYVILLSVVTSRSTWPGVVAFCALSVLFDFGRDAVLFSYAFLFVLSVCSPRTTSDGQLRHYAQWRTIALVLSASALGLLPLIKGSLLLVCIPVALLCATVMWTDRRWVGGALVLLSPAAAAVVFWLIARQPLDDFVPFVANTLAISSGYTDAMSVQGPGGDFGWFAAALAPCLLLAVMVRTRSLHRAAIALGFMLVAFLAFKAGFVRHDGHALTGAQTLVLLGAVSLLAVSTRKHQILGLVALGVTVVCAGVLSTHYTPRVETPLQSIATSYSNAFSGAVDLLEARTSLVARYQQALARIRKDVPLPQLSGSSDIYPTEISALVASGNLWNPRPVFQSYSAYTPRLQQLNVEHLAGNAAPTNVFFQVQPIDGRLPSLEDGASWPALLVNYTPELRINGYLVLRHRADSDMSPRLKILSSGQYKLNESIPISNHQSGPIFLSIQLTPSLLGRSVNFLFKLPELRITLRLRNGSSQTYRYIAGMGRSPFLISPLVWNTDQFRLLYTGSTAAGGLGVTSIQIGTIDDKSVQYWKPRFRAITYVLTNAPVLGVGQVPGITLPRTTRHEVAPANAQSCEGVVDAINEFPPDSLGPSSPTIERVLSVRGWLANSVHQGIVPHTVYVTLSGPAETYYIAAAKMPRPDVAKYFNAPVMENAGYEVEADVTKLPAARYRVGLAYASSGKVMRCPQFAYPIDVQPPRM